MTENQLQELISSRQDVLELFPDAGVRQRAVAGAIPIAFDQVIMSHDWDFAIDVADQTTTATADYTLKGNSDDCRDLINIRYGNGTDGFVLLTKKRPVDMDDFLSNRTISGVGWWVPNGYDISGFPKITIYETPTAGETLRYRYRKSGLTMMNFPEEFSFVLVSAVLSHLFPTYRSIFERDLQYMINNYTRPGGEDMRARLDPFWVQFNNERAQLYGYN